jgi:hypothetical protein
MLAPPAISLLLLRWAWGPLSVPCGPGTPTYRLESNTRKTYCHMPCSLGSCLAAREGSGSDTCPTAQDHASLLERALTSPRVLRLRILPPNSGGLRCCHVSDGFGSCLPTQEGSGAATCPMTLDHASLLGRAPTLPHVPRLCILPTCSGGHRCWHMSHGTGPYLPVREGSDAATSPTALCGPHTSKIKKDLVGLPMRVDSHASKACPHATKMPNT